MILSIIRKLKEDCGNIWRYPRIRCREDGGLNYDTYWEERKRGEKPILSAWQKERADRVLPFLTPGATVLDIGCGDGAVLAYLKEKAHIQGIGVDMSERVIQSAKQAGIETISLDVTDIKKLDTLPEVDYVTGFEIIEHMPYPEMFLFKMMQKARKGIIFSVPNTGYYVHRLRLLFGKFPLQWAVHPGEHLRFWTVRDMKFWLTSLTLNSHRLILYQGIPILNKIFPSLFAKGMIVYINTQRQK